MKIIKKKENNKENKKNNTPKKETILIKNKKDLYPKHSVIVGKVSKKKIIDNLDENKLLNHEIKLSSGNLVNNKKKV